MISVVIPVYKVEKYISACIDSVVNQTIQDYEIILVDDGTPDQSIQLAQERLESVRDIPWKIIHTENRGVSAARNTGIHAAVGEWIIMVDADDILSPTFLEDALNCTGDASDCCIISSGFTVVSEETANSFQHVQEPVVLQKYVAEDAISAFESRKLKFLLPTLLLKKDFLIENQIFFDEQVRYSEDVQFIWRCLFCNKAPVIHLPKANYNYILHSCSTMTASGVEKILTGFSGLERLSEEYTGRVSDETRERIVCLMYFSLLHGAAKMLDYSCFQELSRKAKCIPKLKWVKNGDIRYNAISALLKGNLWAGYRVMRRF